MMKKVVRTYAIATPCAVTDMKYCSGVPTCAPKGLRTHICQVPSTAAARKAVNATQKCTRQSLSAFRTGNSPVLIRLELRLRQYLHGRPHLAMAEAAIFMARHEKITGPCELGVHLGNETRHDHGVHIGAGDQQAVNDVRCCEAHRNSP